MMRILTAGKTRNREGGYTYIMLLIMVAVAGIAASALSVLIYSRMVQAENEKELLFRGIAYQKALKSYYKASTGRKKYPERLEYLIKDDRYPEKKHIRKLYNDPVTGEDWNTIVSGNGGISGVVSKSSRKPLKQADFPKGLDKFENSEKYSDWVFLAK